MDIKQTLYNCIIALGGMSLRVDQPEPNNVAKSVIRALHDVCDEIDRQHIEVQKLDGIEKQDDSDQIIRMSLRDRNKENKRDEPA